MKVYSNDSTIDIFEVVFRNLLEELICRISSAPSQKKKKKKEKQKNQPSQPRIIIFRLLNFKDKENILKNCRKLKGTNIFVNEDFSQETVEHRRGLWKKVNRLHEEERP